MAKKKKDDIEQVDSTKDESPKEPIQSGLRKFDKFKKPLGDK